MSFVKSGKPPSLLSSEVVLISTCYWCSEAFRKFCCVFLCGLCEPEGISFFSRTLYFFFLSRNNLSVKNFAECNHDQIPFTFYGIVPCPIPLDADYLKSGVHACICLHEFLLWAVTLESSKSLFILPSKLERSIL